MTRNGHAGALSALAANPTAMMLHGYRDGSSVAMMVLSEGRRRNGERYRNRRQSFFVFVGRKTVTSYRVISASLALASPGKYLAESNKTSADIHS